MYLANTLPRSQEPATGLYFEPTPVDTLRSSGRYILFRISDWKFIRISNRFHACCVPHPYYSLYFNHLHNVSIVTYILPSNSISDFFASLLGCSFRFLFLVIFLILVPLRLFFLFYNFTFSLPLPSCTAFSFLSSPFLIRCVQFRVLVPLISSVSSYLSSYSK